MSVHRYECQRCKREYFLDTRKEGEFRCSCGGYSWTPCPPPDAETAARWQTEDAETDKKRKPN